jgi:hypothetical protein
MWKNFARIGVLVTALAVVTGAGCGSDGDGDGQDRPDLTGALCELPEDCFPDVDREELAGEVRCLTRVRGGYCTHLCEVDTDCCAVEGACLSDFAQVCSPFESTGENMCFLSCEAADIPELDGGVEDDEEYCQREAGTDFVCRSSGGGADNRKVCVPGVCGVGATCADDEDCAPDLICLTRFDGGYCSVPDCGADAPCPPGSVCAELSGGNVCVRTCTAASDCSFCRGVDRATDCATDVPLLEADGVSVCDPR